MLKEEAAEFMESSSLSGGLLPLPIFSYIDGTLLQRGLSLAENFINRYGCK